MSNEIQKTEKKLIDEVLNLAHFTENESNQLIAAKDFIISCIKDVPMYRTMPTKLFGVLNDNDHPTLESKYWQSKAEAEVHAEECLREMHDLEIMKIRYEEADWRLSVLTTEIDALEDENKKKELTFKARELAVVQSKMKLNMNKIEKTLKFRIKEISDWFKITEELKKKLDESGVKISTFDEAALNSLKARAKAVNKNQEITPINDTVTDSGEPKTNVV